MSYLTSQAQFSFRSTITSHWNITRRVIQLFKCCFPKYCADFASPLSKILFLIMQVYKGYTSH